MLQYHRQRATDFFLFNMLLHRSPFSWAAFLGTWPHNLPTVLIHHNVCLSMRQLVLEASCRAPDHHFIDTNLTFRAQGCPYGLRHTCACWFQGF